MEGVLEELDAQRQQAERKAEIKRREQPAGGVQRSFDEAFDHEASQVIGRDAIVAVTRGDRAVGSGDLTTSKGGHIVHMTAQLQRMT